MNATGSRQPTQADSLPETAEAAPVPETRLPSSKKLLLAVDIATAAVTTAEAGLMPLVEEQALLQQAVVNASKKELEQATASLDAHGGLVLAQRQAIAAATQALTQAHQAIRSERQRKFAVIQSERLMIENAVRRSTFTCTYEEAREVLDARMPGKRSHATWKAVQVAWNKKAGPNKILPSAPSAWNPLVAASMRTAGMSRAERQRAESDADAAASEATAELKQQVAAHFTRLSETFKRWDIDHDSAISLVELKLALGHLSIPYTRRSPTLTLTPSL